MLAWLYDEDRWSSGPAGGLVTQNKEFRRKRLMLFPEDQGWNSSKAEAMKTGESYLLAVYDIVLDSDGYLEKYSRIDKDAESDGNKWYAYCVTEKESPWFNYQTYIDAMDQEAVAEFIKITYERYKECTEAILEIPFCQGYCYTQLTDIMQEINGLLTPDRKPKVSPERIQQINRNL